MKTVELIRVSHDQKQGQRCPELEPNITESCLLVEDGELVGFYIDDLSFSSKITSLLNIANTEFIGDNVPKQLLDRTDIVQKTLTQGLSRSEARKVGTLQYSTIIGSVPAIAIKRRFTHRRSQVHAVPSAKNFIKAMLMLADEASAIYRELMPDAYERQLRNLQSVPENLRFGPLWTSSISNLNISAPYHTDRGNLPQSLNVIFTKRMGSKGGCLNVPDYSATFDQKDNSMLVYPAWRNMHGVTPIEELFPGGYRNSLVLYALNLGGLKL